MLHRCDKTEQTAASEKVFTDGTLTAADTRYKQKDRCEKEQSHLEDRERLI